MKLTRYIPWSRSWATLAASCFAYILTPCLYADSLSIEGGLDANNPWWLVNTKIVNYCLTVDLESNSVSENEVDQAFLTAAHFWKKESESQPIYKDGRRVDVAFPVIKVATQQFQRIGCDQKDVDLKIFVGKRALDSMSRGYLGAGSESIPGIAVRTSYDRRNLHGTGFIFINDDLKLIDWNKTIIGDEIHPVYFYSWTHSERLVRSFIHQLGHAFGVPHLRNSVMDIEAPEQYLSSDFYNDLVKINGFADIPNKISSCTNYGNGFETYFPSVSGNRCVELEFEYSLGVNLSSFDKPGSNTVTEIGRISFDISETNSSTLVKIYLPEEQKVFDYRNPHDPLQGNIRSAKKIMKHGTFEHDPSMSFNLEMTHDHITILGTRAMENQPPRIDYIVDLGRSSDGNWIHERYETPVN